MIHRQIDLDEKTDQILAELAKDYDGDLGKALADLIHAHESLEAFVDDQEQVNRDTLLAQLDRAERGFREGRSTTWDDVKNRNGL